MTQAPDRIFASTFRTEAGPTRTWSDSLDQADDDAPEYIQADLVDALNERIERLERRNADLEGALEQVAGFAPTEKLNGGHNDKIAMEAVRVARAVIQPPLPASPAK